MLANKILHRDHTTQEAQFLNIKIVYKPCRQDTYSPQHSLNGPIKTAKITPHYVEQKLNNKKKNLLYTVVCGLTLVIYMWFSHYQNKYMMSMNICLKTMINNM